MVASIGSVGVRVVGEDTLGSVGVDVVIVPAMGLVEA